MSPTFRALSIPNYRLYAAGAIVSNIGTWMQRVAQDWLVLQLTDNSGVALGITTGLQFLPILLLSPFAGLVADRLPKRRLLQVTQVMMAVPAMVLGVLAVTGLAQAWHVYVLAFAFGVGTAFDAPVRQSFVSELVGPEDLTNAVGLNSASANAARVVGPALAGGLIALLGSGPGATGWVIIANAVSYLPVMVALQCLDRRQLRPSEPAARGPGMIRDGVRYVGRRADLTLVMIVLFIAGTFGMNFQLTSALMLTDVFDKGAREFGLVGSTMAIGALAGALMAARRATSTPKLVVTAAVAFAVVEIIAGVLPSYVAFVIWSPLLGFTSLSMITGANATLQLETAPEYRGRVMALFLVVFLGGTPLGAPIVGWVGEQFGARWTLIGGGAITLLGVSLAVAIYLRQAARQALREDAPAVVANA